MRLGDERVAILLTERREHRIRSVPLDLVREVDPCQLVLAQPACEDVGEEMRRGAGAGRRLRDEEREPPVWMGAATTPEPLSRLPELDEAVLDRGGLPVQQAPR